ncbi:Malectin-like carbohydrate-binding domain containing protein [Parasponia andersonii]|uniref:Malectin-like carbohydrate-binding domain containing protein n=1 Tax=Parasponia andersonii TaxID=3476 RepID=A0A2P5D0Z1_PARAD|nr:Malectin-like carbohydrate-binding domain containing protein [Parasponia andersonii]
MEKYRAIFMVLILLALSSFPAYSGQLELLDYADLNIDCGATIKTKVQEMTWETDEEFIETGVNNFLMTFTDANPYQMKTLRSFPVGDKNCYNLPFLSQKKCVVRAGFYYGNYDSLSKPPTFVLEVDGKLRATVKTSLSDEPIYHQFVFISEKASVDVCLIRTQEDHVPFISTIESALIPDLQAYRLMPGQMALYNLESGINYGANHSVPLNEALFKLKKFSGFRQHLPKGDDAFNRTGTAEEVSSYSSRTPGRKLPTSWALIQNSAPSAVIDSAIESHNYVYESILISTSLSLLRLLIWIDQ